MKNTVKCRTCNNPVGIPALVDRIIFPRDAGPVIDLLEARLNVVTCAVCATRSAVLAPVMAINSELAAIVCVLPGGSERAEDEMRAKMPAGVEMKVARNYYELYQLMLPWLNGYYLPISASLFSGSYERETRQAQIDLFSPLFIRIFKGQIDGNIDVTVQTQGDASPEQVNEYLTGIYNALVCEQLQRITLEAAKTGSLLNLFDEVGRRIPQSCITPEALSCVAEMCKPLTSPYEDPASFMAGFRQEYLNAVAHARAGADNPRGKAWATYLMAAWMFGRNENVVLDPQFSIPAEVVRSTLRFDNLWDATMCDLLGTMEEAKDMKAYSGTLEYISEMMKHYGFADEYLETMRAGSIKIQLPEGAGPELSDSMLASFKKVLSEQLRFNVTREESARLGGVAGAAVGQLLRNSMNEVALRLAEDVLAQALDEGDKTAAVSFAKNVVEQFNLYELYAEAQGVIGKVMDIVADDMTQFEPAMMVAFWNEVGNVFRYMNQYNAAVRAYEIVSKLMDVLPDDEEKDARRSTLNRNLAIVYRNMGRYRKSLALLQEELDKNPEQAELQHSVATLYSYTNRHRQALAHLDKAIALSRGELNAYTRANYLTSRGVVRQNLGDREGALRDFAEAFRLCPEKAAARRLRIASGVIGFHDLSEGDFVRECRELVTDAINSGEHDESPSLIAAMVMRLAEHLLREGNVRGAYDAVMKEWEWLKESGSLPWEALDIMGRVLYALGKYEDSWRLMRAALTAADKSVPSAEDAAFAPSWMSDKETFQSGVSSIALDLTERGLIPVDQLLPVFEFMNGKEISTRLVGGDSRAAGRRVGIRERYSERLDSVKMSVETFFFVEAGDKIRLANLSAGGPRLLGEPVLDRRHVAGVKRRTRDALKWANPADLLALTARLEPWNELAAQLGAAIHPHLSEGCQVRFLPGRAFTGLPLHLMILPGGDFLLERHPVGYAPNFATLLAEGGAAGRTGAGPSTVISVTKEYDPEDFKARARGASERLLEMIGGLGDVKWLDGAEADHEAVKAALRDSAEVVFICHGTTAGQEKGYGVCIADDGELPPTLLPAAEVPELGRFILTWQDIDGLDASAVTVVSIACSSGVTEVASGGVRYGLEQSLFGSGTRVIISPLWDVEQTSALAFLENFYGLRSGHPDWAVERVFQSACMGLRERYPHPYFWGTYILNGALF